MERDILVPKKRKVPLFSSSFLLRASFQHSIDLLPIFFPFFYKYIFFYFLFGAGPICRSTLCSFTNLRVSGNGPMLILYTVTHTICCMHLRTFSNPSRSFPVYINGDHFGFNSGPTTNNERAKQKGIIKEFWLHFLSPLTKRNESGNIVTRLKMCVGTWKTWPSRIPPQK